MNFEDTLRELTEKVGVAAVIIGKDGIPVGSYATPEFPYNVEDVATEQVSLIKSLEDIETLKALGDLRELTLLTDSFRFFLAPISSDYFLILATNKDTYPGKARFILRRTVERLKKEF